MRNANCRVSEERQVCAVRVGLSDHGRPGTNAVTGCSNGVGRVLAQRSLEWLHAPGSGCALA